MATTIVCTPGGSSDNCYVTITQANTHFTSGLREETWDSYPSLLREQALIQATQDIERLGGPRVTVNSCRRARFPGSPYTTDIDSQALHFPRGSDVDDDGTTKVIPTAVQEAVCEQAWWLLQQRSNPALIDTDDLRARGVQSLSMDGTSVSLGATSVPRGIAPQAWDRIRAYVAIGRPTVARAETHKPKHRGSYHA